MTKKIGGYSHTVGTVHLHSLKIQKAKHSTYEINDMVVKDSNYRWLNAHYIYETFQREIAKVAFPFKLDSLLFKW